MLRYSRLATSPRFHELREVVWMATSPRPPVLSPRPLRPEPDASARARDVHLLVVIDRVRNGLRSSRQQGQQLTNACGSRASQQGVGDGAQLQAQKAREQPDAP